MTAEIISVGNELMDGFTVDTHAATLARVLAESGIERHHRQTVSDEWENLVDALRVALERSDIVITIGGLGPTGDDLTREAIAEALGDAPVFEPEIEERNRRFFAQRNIPYSDAQKKQAMRPESGRIIDNPNGTAPGIVAEKNGQTVIALPGPRGEFVPMVNGPVKEILARLSGGKVIAARTLKICGMGESQVETLIKELMYQENPRVAPYAHPSEVHLRITAQAGTKEEADRLIQGTHERIQSVLGDAIFGCDEATLESTVVDLLKQQDKNCAVAESLTGGELGARFTSVAGVSEAFKGGVISYTTEVKEALLGVRHETLEEHGPVSEPTAREMAEGARRVLKADYGISLTGNAGPTSDKDNKPVGLVYVGVAGPKDTVVEEHRFRGTREDIRRRSTQVALVLLRNILLGHR